MDFFRFVEIFIFDYGIIEAKILCIYAYSIGDIFFEFSFDIFFRLRCVVMFYA